MRLLVDCRIGWGAGIGRMTANLLPRVARLRPGWRIDALVNPTDAARARAALETVDNLTVRETPHRPFSIGEQTGLPRLARHYDATWFTNYWVPLAWRGRFAVTVHDTLHLEADLFPASIVKRRLSRMTFRKVARDASAIIFVSRFTKREFGRRFATAARCAVIGHGADHLAAPLPALPLPERRRSMVVVAAAKPHKNFRTVMAAWRAARLGPDWTLTVVTPNEFLRSSVDPLAGHVDVPGVELIKGMNDADLAELYRRAAAVLMPSRYEGFGLPVLEALAAGTPVIASTAEALVEIAQDASVTWVNPLDTEGWRHAITRRATEFDAGEHDLPALLANQALTRRQTWDDAARAVAAELDALTAP